MKRSLIFLSLILSLLCLPSFGSQIKISIAQPPNAPYFMGIPESNIDSDKFSTIVLRIRSKESGVVGLFWTSSDAPQTNGPTGVWFSVDRSNAGREYALNLRSQSRYWTGFIRQFVIHPESGTEGFIIESAAAEPANLVSNIRSGWQEFWGPSSRIVLGTTVNNMEATRLYGIPINWYAYAIILLSSILIFAYSFFRTKKPVSSWRNCGKTAIAAAIACWGILEFSSSVNQYNQLKNDYNRYDFKSLEEKRAALVGTIVGDNFYKFIGFCGGSIKGRPGVSVISSGPNGDFYRERLKYFLYPLNFFPKEPEYIIVIDYDKGLKETLGEHPGFRLFKKYNEGAYILWKKKT
jgi:hypothetical protein